MFCALCWPRLRVLSIISDTLDPSEWPDDDLFRARGSQVSRTWPLINVFPSALNGERWRNRILLV